MNALLAVGSFDTPTIEYGALLPILIILGAACLFIINRLAGSKMGGVFG